jgi:hypothetical protein
VARGFLHEFSGMVVFALGMMVLFMEMNILNRIRLGMLQKEYSNDQQ